MRVEELIGIVALSTLAACGSVQSNIDAKGSGDAPGGTPDTPDVDAPPVLTVHQAFVANANNNSNGNLGVFTTLPLTSSSAPSFNLGTTNGLSAPSAVRMGPGGQRLWVLDAGANKILAFTLPLTSTSQPVVTLTVANTPVDMRFDSAGNLWVAEFAGKIEEWAAPPSGASAKTLSTGSTSNVFGLAFDAAGTLYAGGPGPTLFAFANPLTATTPSVSNTLYGGSISGLAVTAGKLYVSSYQSGQVGYYTLPLTATSAPVNVTQVVYGWKLSFTPAGELIVPGNASNQVNFYTPPAFTAVAVNLSMGLLDPRSVEFSP